MKTSASKGTYNGKCRLSEAELSRVMSAHAAGQLICCGNFRFHSNKGCLLQVALNEGDNITLSLVHRLRARAGSRTIKLLIRAFDEQYESSWTPSRLVKFLVNHGLA